MAPPNPISFLYNSIRTQVFAAPPPPTHSFTNQTFIVTGANTGLGAAAVEHFVRLDAARVILTSRDLRKGEDALTRIEKATGKTGVIEVWQLDLSSAKSVKAFAQRAERELERLDVLVENAGVDTGRFERVGDEVTEGTGQGAETVLAVNVVGTFHLAVLLLPLLMRSARGATGPARLCVVSSDLHFLADEFPQRKSADILAELDKEDSVGSGFERYGQQPAILLFRFRGCTDTTDRYYLSKMVEILVAKHMARLVSKKSSNSSNPSVIINTVNPGLVDTELAREQGVFARVFKFVFRAWNPEVGARCLVNAAGMGVESHGMHTSNGFIAP